MLSSRSRLFFVWILFLLLMFPTTLFSQEHFVFSHDSDVFIEQVESILRNSTNEKVRDKSRDLVPQLVERWKMGRFNRIEKDAIKSIAQQLVDDGLKNDAAFFIFFRTVNDLAYSLQLHNDLSNYFVAADNLYKNKGKVAFRSLLLFSDKFFAEKLLNSRSGANWYLRDSQYHFSEDGDFRIIVESCDLVCVGRTDSTVIKNTSGVFHLNDLSWNGKGGRVSWRRYGLDDVYVRLDEYAIDLKSLEYQADSVKYYNKNVLSEPLTGVFQDKVLINTSLMRAEYPFFKAYSEDRIDKKLYKNIYISGQVGMKGRHIAIMGNRYDDAEMIFMLHDTIKARLSAKDFVLMENMVRAENIDFKIYFHGDSICHSGISMQYDEPKRELTLIADKINGMYWDSYHNIDVFSEAVYWNVDTDKLIFNKLQSPNNESVAYFKSGNFFNRVEFDDLQMMDQVNPLIAIDGYLKTYKTDFVDLHDLATYLGYDGNETLNMIMFLVRRGYFTYDRTTKLAYPKKDFFVAVNASRKKSDYDVIRVISVTNQFNPNLEIDMESSDLKMYGVNRVILGQYVHHDTVDIVQFMPYDKTITVKRHLEMEFSGYMRLGQYGFYTKNSVFKYDDFLIDLPQVDSISFTTNSGENVKNVIVNTSGVFYINKKDNKSGTVFYDNYPIYESNKESYVYFDNPSINGGKLDRNRFSFVIPDFRVEGIFALKTFSQDGVFHSGIFPDFDETLKVMPDNSFGFEHYIGDPKGVEIYGGKAVFHDSIHLSNMGFYGNGSIDFMTTFVDSPRLDFYPDSVNCITRNFEMLAVNDELLSYPYVTVDKVSMRLNMVNNKMRLKTLENPLQLYDGCKFAGNASLDSTGFVGGGRLNVEKAKVDSKYFTFKEMDMVADSSVFTVMSNIANKDAFVASNYKSAIDFTTRQGYFTGIGSDKGLRFPLNKIRSNLDYVEWYMDDQKLAITSNKKDTYLKTTNVENTVIDFSVNKCNYDLNAYVLTAFNTSEIKVADVKIDELQPLINIHPNAVIDTLQNASFAITTLGYRHEFYQATISFDEENCYHANAFMNYAKGKKILWFDHIWSEPKGFTKAVSHISEDNEFTICQRFNFRGDLTLDAEEKNLLFDGDFQVNSFCSSDFRWFKSKHNVKDIPIKDINNYSSFKNATEKNLTITLNHLDHNSGVFYDPTNKRFYTSFMSETTFNNPNKKAVASMKGHIRYDVDKGTYHLSKMEMKTGVLKSGKDTICRVTVEDKLILGITNSIVVLNAESRFVEDIKSGQINMDFKEKSTWSFPLDKKLVEIIHKNFCQSKSTKNPATFMFDEVNMRWNEEQHCFYSTKAFKLMSLLGKKVGENTNGYIIIDYKDGVSMTLYLENNKKWIYFSYKNGYMATVSSVDAYNRRLQEINKGKRVTVIMKSLGRFEYGKTTVSDKEAFVQKIKDLRSK